MPTKALDADGCHFAQKVLMVRPLGIRENQETLQTNQFQNKFSDAFSSLHESLALNEFTHFVKSLTDFGIQIQIFNPSDAIKTPDAVFPNNWISFHDEIGPTHKIFLYPMFAPNRRLERSVEIIQAVNDRLGPYELIDLSELENENQYLEGTGSLVLDRRRKKAYACLSSRTCKSALTEFEKKSGYTGILFEALDPRGEALYHTNVFMSLGSSVAVYGEDCLSRDSSSLFFLENLKSDFSKHLIIDWNQIKNFCANIILLSNDQRERAWFMSTRAADCYSAKQKSILEKDGKIIATDVSNIELIGGGSVRCMVAEIF
jgi:hypothetical protein